MLPAQLILIGEEMSVYTCVLIFLKDHGTFGLNLFCNLCHTWIKQDLIQICRTFVKVCNIVEAS